MAKVEAQRVKEIQKKYQVSLWDAKRIALKEKMLEEIGKATDIEDLKNVFKQLIESVTLNA